MGVQAPQDSLYPKAQTVVLEAGPHLETQAETASGTTLTLLCDSSCRVFDCSGSLHHKVGIRDFTPTFGRAV